VRAGEHLAGPRPQIGRTSSVGGLIAVNADSVALPERGRSTPATPAEAQCTNSVSRADLQDLRGNQFTNPTGPGFWNPSGSILIDPGTRLRPRPTRPRGNDRVALRPRRRPVQQPTLASAMSGSRQPRSSVLSSYSSSGTSELLAKLELPW